VPFASAECGKDIWLCVAYVEATGIKIEG